MKNEIEFSIQDSVQLLNGLTPTMTISEINADNQTALCVWYDRSKKKINKEWLPLNVLKITPVSTPISKDELLNAVYRR